MVFRGDDEDEDEDGNDWPPAPVMEEITDSFSHNDSFDRDSALFDDDI